jgi:hypothetical protein
VPAREYGFAGWQHLREEVIKRTGNGLEWAGAQAQRAIHNNDIERLTQLLREHSALLAWRDDFDETLLGSATGSFGDSGNPYSDGNRSARAWKVHRALSSADACLDWGPKTSPQLRHR